MKFVIKSTLSYKTENDTTEVRPPNNILRQIIGTFVKDLLRYEMNMVFSFLVLSS